MTASDEPPVLLAARDLAATIGNQTILPPASLDLRSGEILGVMGENGVGKTTLLRTIMGDLPLGSGRVWIGGREISALPADGRARAGLVYLPQRNGIFERLSIGENLDVARAAGESDRSGVEWLRLLLPEALGREREPASLLSGGERQLLAIAMALSRPALVYLLDEPFAGLAAERATIASSLVVSWMLEGRKAAMIVDHDPIRAAGYSRIIEL